MMGRPIPTLLVQTAIVSEGNCQKKRKWQLQGSRPALTEMDIHLRPNWALVRVVGLEPTASWSQTMRANQLRYTRIWSGGYPLLKDCIVACPILFTGKVVVQRLPVSLLHLCFDGFQINVVAHILSEHIDIRILVQLVTR